MNRGVDLGLSDNFLLGIYWEERAPDVIENGNAPY